MHELSIAQSIIDAVARRAEECHATQVKNVRLRVGEAYGIVNSSLTFCFEMIVSAEPTLANAQLLIEDVPHRAKCSQCKQEFRVLDFVARCPTCETFSSEIVSGNELLILDMEIETDVGRDDAGKPC